MRCGGRGTGGETYLDDEIEVAEVVVAAGGGVAAHDVLAVDLSRDGDVLADGQAEDVFGVGQLEAVAGTCVTRGGRGQAGGDSQSSVRGDDDLFRERELLPLLGIEDGLTFCGRD